MKKVYDFSKGRRGAALTEKGKTRVTVALDDVIARHFKAISQKTGEGYQMLINDALAERIAAKGAPLTAAAVRRIVREEIAGLRDHLESARSKAPHQAYMELAGCVRGPKNLSSRKGFSRG